VPDAWSPLLRTRRLPSPQLCTWCLITPTACPTTSVTPTLYLMPDHPYCVPDDFRHPNFVPDAWSPLLRARRLPSPQLCTWCLITPADPQHPSCLVSRHGVVTLSAWWTDSEHPSCLVSRHGVVTLSAWWTDSEHPNFVPDAWSPLLSALCLITLSAWLTDFEHPNIVPDHNS
jgi:hypothetical protein